MFDILNICVEYEQYYIKLYNVICELYNVYMKKQLKIFKFCFSAGRFLYLVYMEN